MLSPKQKLFVQEYLKDKNATRAAKAAGYSKKTAVKIGSENLRKPDVAKAIEVGLAKQMAKTEISAERVINRIAEFAFGKKKNLAPKDILKANELLGKHFGVFTDVIQSTNLMIPTDQVSPEKAVELYKKIKGDC